MSGQPPEENQKLLHFIADTVESMRDRMDEMSGRIDEVREQMATKDDLARLETKLSDRMEAGFAAVRGDIERVRLRLDGIERALSSRLDHVEAEVSRLRSVVYLLVKDRPDMLRLLGQTPPDGA